MQKDKRQKDAADQSPRMMERGGRGIKGGERGGSGKMKNNKREKKGRGRKKFAKEWKSMTKKGIVEEIWHNVVGG